MKFKFLHKMIFVLLVIFIATPCFGQSQKSKMSAKTKAEIIETILKRFFEDYPDEINSDKIILSKSNISPLLNPNKFSKKLVLMNYEEIVNKVKREGATDYLIFSEFKADRSIISIKMELLSVTNIKSTVTPFFGHGFFWEVKKKSGKWVAKCVNTSAFTSVSGDMSLL